MLRGVLVLLVFWILPVEGPPLPSQADAVARIQGEIDRVRGQLGVVPEADRGVIAGRLERSKAALDKGRTYLALYELESPFETTAGYALAAQDKSYPAKADFERKWKTMGEPAVASSRAPLQFTEALAQAAEGRAPATYRASLPYSEDAQMTAGLYYLAESHAMSAFAGLARALALRPMNGAAPKLSTLEPHLTDYETRVVKAYDGASAALRPRYPSIHVSIKVARTLQDQKRLEGALLQYLLSRYRFGVAQTLDAPEPSAAGLSAKLAAVKLPAGDHSVGEFFLQLAAACAEGADPGPRAAAIILDDVIPAYLTVVKP